MIKTALLSKCCGTYLVHPSIENHDIVKCAACGRQYTLATPISLKHKKEFFPFEFNKWISVPHREGHRVVKIEAAAVDGKYGVNLYWTKAH